MKTCKMEVKILAHTDISTPEIANMLFKEKYGNKKMRNLIKNEDGNQSKMANPKQTRTTQKRKNKKEMHETLSQCAVVEVGKTTRYQQPRKGFQSLASNKRRKKSLPKVVTGADRGCSKFDKSITRKKINKFTIQKKISNFQNNCENPRKELQYLCLARM